MIKITEPGYTFPQRLFKRMQVLQERAKNKEERAAKRTEERDEKKEAGKPDKEKAEDKTQSPRGLFGPPGPFRGCGRRGRGGMFGPFGTLHHGGMGMGQGGAWAAAAPALDAMMKVNVFIFSHISLFLFHRAGLELGPRVGHSMLSSTPRPWRRP